MRFFIKGIGFVNTIILTRILSPADFGVVAIVMAIYAFIDLLKQFGFDVVLIQNQEATDEHYNTAWTIQLLFGSVAGVLMFIFSGHIAGYYEDARLEDVAKLVALMFLISGLSNIGVVNFRKDLNFRREFNFRVMVKVISVICTVTIALLTRNYWALVVGMLISAALETLLSYYWSKYRPRFCLTKIKELFSFSSWLMLTNFFFYLNVNFGNLVVGKYLGVGPTGIYRIVSEFGSIVNSDLIPSVNRAAYPGYAKISKDINGLRQLYLNVLSSIVLIGVPLSIGIAAISPFFVVSVFGPEWAAGSQVMMIIAISQAIACVNSNSGYIYLSLGKPRISTFVLFCRVSLFITLLLLLIEEYGLLGVAYSGVTASAVMFPVHYFLLRYFISLEFKDYLKCLFRPVAASFCAFFMSHYVYSVIFKGIDPLDYGLVELFIAGAVYAVFYISLHGIFWSLVKVKSQSVEMKIIGAAVEKFRG